MFKKLMIYTILFVCLDQFSKLAISFFMNINESITIIPNFFKLTYVENTGAAFSIFTGFRFIFIIISIVALNLIYKFYIKDKELKKYETVIYSMLIGGIIGNMIDRIIYGHVIDFLSFKFINYEFAIFNIADSLIVVSVIILLIDSIRREKCKNM